MPDGDELQEIRARLDAIERRLGMGGGQAPAPLPSAPPARTGEAPILHGKTTSGTLESLIGAHWLNRIGIAAVFVGVAFFLKYAFENNWIGPAMRVGIGVACGIALLGWAEAFHAKRNVLFAHTLDVIGTGVLYLSIWAASQTYTLIGNGGAFAAMVIVTIAVVTLALRHRSEFLAGVALTGGFLTPVLLSTGINREVELFAYVALLDVAALVLVALHPWMRALAVAFFGTIALYVAWAADYYTPAQNERTIGFVTLFFLLFGILPLLRRASRVFLLLPFANGLVYFAQLTYLLDGRPKQLSLFAATLALFYLAIAAAVRLRDDDLTAAHLALALGFITIAIPLRYEAHWITIGWLAESAALFVLARRLRTPHQRVLDILASIALALGVFRMLFLDHYHDIDRVVVYAMAITIFAGLARTSAYPKLAIFAMNFLAVIELTYEVTHRLVSHEKLAQDFSRSAVWMAYGAMLMVIGFRRRDSYIRWLALALIGVTVFKVFLYDMSELQRIYRILSFIALGVLLLATSFAYQASASNARENR
jgi:uncharacterized membrane protein